MNKALRNTLIVIGILVLAGGAVFTGAWIGQRTASNLAWSQPVYRMMNAGGVSGRGYGMTLAPALRSGASAGVGSGGGYGMMSGYGYNYAAATSLTVDQAYQASVTYLAALNNPELRIAEVMVFENNAYVRVVEQSTGVGAFELLVDPATLAVYPEHGPNMMWNLKYAGLNHQNMMNGRGGRMGYSTGYSTFSGTPVAVSADMPVISAQALEVAQQYLDTALPGTKTGADADPFYGYYTIDILRDGQTIGMLSLNGYTSQVFMHTWHGTFIAEQEY